MIKDRQVKTNNETKKNVFNETGVFDCYHAILYLFQTLFCLDPWIFCLKNNSSHF